MNAQIMLMTVRQSFWQIALIAGFFLAIIGTDIYDLFSSTESVALSIDHFEHNAIVFTLILGAGVIGRDISSGILPLIFSRPIRRWEYVISKWLAIASISSFIILALIGCHQLIMHMKSAQLGLDIGLLDCVHITSRCFGTAGVMVLLSSIIAGYADIGFFLLFSMPIPILKGLAYKWEVPEMAASADTISTLLNPFLDLRTILYSNPICWQGIGAYLSIISFCLLGAVLLVNQKELTYGAN
jgi:ABC-type transport system involved in multi-copper enzyme maturation permease subunit